MKIINSIIFLVTIFALHSCHFGTLLTIMSSEVTVKEIESDHSKIHFIGMTHFGKKEFYKKVENEIVELKQEGAVLFYEYIDYSTADSKTLRKTQKIVGMVPTPENYKRTMTQVFEDESFQAQNNDQFINLVNNKDFNIDYSPERIIKEYEEQFGEIILTKEDLKLSLDSLNKNTLSNKQLNLIIMDHRNKYLAQEIQKSSFKNIIVLYGAAHSKGLLKELKKIDKSWVKTQTRKVN